MSPSKSKQKIGAEKSHQQAIKPRLMYNQPELRVLVFKILESEYVFDVSRIQEIIQPKELAHLDGIPGYVEGLLKRRGHIVPVVDLRKRLDLEIAPHRRKLRYCGAAFFRFGWIFSRCSTRIAQCANIRFRNPISVDRWD